MTVTSPPRTPEAIRLEDYRRPPYLARTVDLLFDLHDDHALVTSTVGYVRNPEADVGTELLLDGVGLQLESVTLDDAALEDGDFQIADGRLRLDPGTDAFTLQVVTRIEPQNNTTLSGLYRSGAMFCTQMEAQGFRRVTWFQDRPDVLSVYTTTIVANRAAYPVLLGNGNRIDSGEAADGRHFVTWHDPFPKPCYLFALVAGDLACLEDGFTTRSGRDIQLQLWFDAGNEDRTPHAMASLKRAMRWDEEVFGREYDLDLFMIVAVNDFNMGAMENKGLNLFNAQAVLASRQTSTDADFERIEGIVAHEYFHNWSGNRVTCRDWFQLSLKEGFTVFRDQEFSADMHSRPVKRIGDVRLLRKMQFAEDAGPLSHPVRPSSYISIDNFYTRTVYEKGAEVIRMIHALLGSERFRKGSDLYFERHDGEAATVEDFVRAMTDASGIDLTQFQRWYSQAGTPHVKASGRHDAATGTYELTLEQSCGAAPGLDQKEPFHIPVRVGLLGPDGEDLPLHVVGDDGEDAGPSGATEVVLDLRQSRQTFRFSDVASPPVPSILRGFSAPVRLSTDLDEEQLLFLSRNDSDLFNRWEAIQQLAHRALLRLVGDARAERPLAEPDALLAAMEAVLADEQLDPALAAEALFLPEAADVAELLDEVDPDAIHAAHEFVTRSFATRCSEALARTYGRCAGPEDPSATGNAVGRRALKNACLSHLVATGEDRFLESCDEQMRNAENMTDELAALELLADGDSRWRAPALERFRERWSHDALVMNKWFKAQAAARRAATIDDVERLAADPLFDAGNPNHVRSLYRTFGENLMCFHAADGRGYRLMADVVLDIDSRNPILSGRLAGAFNSWRTLEPRRRELCRAQLQRLLDAKGISPNLYEVTSKTLA